LGRQGAGCYSGPALGRVARSEARSVAPKDAVAFKLFRRLQICCRSSRRLRKIVSLGHVDEKGGSNLKDEKKIKA